MFASQWFFRDLEMFAGMQKAWGDFLRVRESPAESFSRAHFSDLAVGMEFTRTFTVPWWKVVLFGLASGDLNPLHFVKSFCATTMFKEPIAHGLLTAGFVSAIFGNDLPGPGAIFISQEMKFLHPVRAGDVVVTTVAVKELNPKKPRATFSFVSIVGSEKVLEGEAVLLIP